MISIVLMLRLIEVADIHPDPVPAVWHRVYSRVAQIFAGIFANVAQVHLSIHTQNDRHFK